VVQIHSPDHSFQSLPRVFCLFVYRTVVDFVDGQIPQGSPRKLSGSYLPNLTQCSDAGSIPIASSLAGELQLQSITEHSFQGHHSPSSLEEESVTYVSGRSAFRTCLK